MKLHVVNIVNAFSLMLMSTWGFLASATPSITSMIPAAFGVILLLCSIGIKKQKKSALIIALLFTLLILIAFYWPLIAVIKKENLLGVFRVAFMMLTCFLSLIVFVKSLAVTRKRIN